MEKAFLLKLYREKRKQTGNSYLFVFFCLAPQLKRKTIFILYPHFLMMYVRQNLFTMRNFLFYFQISLRGGIVKSDIREKAFEWCQIAILLEIGQTILGSLQISFQVEIIASKISGGKPRLFSGPSSCLRLKIHEPEPRAFVKLWLALRGPSPSFGELAQHCLKFLNFQQLKSIWSLNQLLVFYRSMHRAGHRAHVVAPGPFKP